MHITDRPREGGGFVVSTTQKLVLKRGATALETEGSSSVVEDARGRVQGFRTTQKMAKEANEAVGVLEDGAFAVTDTLGGKNPRASRVPLDPDAVGLHRAEEILREKLKIPGDTIEVTIFVPEFRKCTRQKAVFEREEEVDLQGKKKTLRRVKVTLDALPNVETVAWYDDAFETQKSVISILGMEMITYRSTPEAVLAEDLSSPPEIFFASSIPVSRKIPSDAIEATYKITSKTGTFPVKPGGKLFPAAGQEVVNEDVPAVRVLRVRMVTPRETPALPLKIQPELDEYLRASSFIQSDDREIVDVAKKQAGTERDALKVARGLEKWVHENVKGKNLNTAFATAKEVLETREGDCTEHSVLLAALLRAAGLPSRVVAGLVYYDGVFVGHMWTEVHIGEWVPLDAAMGRSAVGADHIALSTSSLDSANVAEVFLDILPVIGNARIEVVSVGG